LIDFCVVRKLEAYATLGFIASSAPEFPSIIAVMDDQRSHEEPPESAPGKTRTWWHPLLVQSLTYLLSSAYQVTGELLVGKLPLSIDIFLVKREDGELWELAREEAKIFVRLLNQFTLVEFKGPTDALERGDVSRLLGCALLWFGQQKESVPGADVTLMFLAPTWNGPARNELRALGHDATELEPGVYQIHGLPFSAWALETDNVADREPLLAFFSQMFVRDRRGIIERYLHPHRQIIYFMLQQVEQLAARGEDYLMQFKNPQDLDEIEEELKEAVLRILAPDERLRGLALEDRLRGLAPEDRLRGLAPEDRLRGLTPEDRLRGLAPEDRLRGLAPEDRLHGLAPEDRLRGLAPEDRVRDVALEDRLRGLSKEQLSELRRIIETKESQSN
jgi:hypothetical protein